MIKRIRIALLTALMFAGLGFAPTSWAQTPSYVTIAVSKHEVVPGVCIHIVMIHRPNQLALTSLYNADCALEQGHFSLSLDSGLYAMAEIHYTPRGGIFLRRN